MSTQLLAKIFSTEELSWLQEIQAVDFLAELLHQVNKNNTLWQENQMQDSKDEVFQKNLRQVLSDLHLESIDLDNWQQVSYLAQEWLKKKIRTHLKEQLEVNDMAYIRGQKVAKRALEIAAAGGHNVMFIGAPGSGKTLLARSYPTILPAMTETEILETTQIYSVAGLLQTYGQETYGVILKRPFRAPHHSASHVALVGGGSVIKPGEVSLAHRGVLFLDEFPEFSREAIEALRQPLEDGFVQISRASGSVTFPAKFYLIAAANPTPSGFSTNETETTNSPSNRLTIARYQARFSGPILDRIDLHVEVNRPSKEELQTTSLAEKSAEIAKRVQKARDIQTYRFKNVGNLTVFCNGEMTLPLIEQFCRLDTQGQTLLAQAMDKFKLTARSYMRILKLARTIADLAESESIQVHHLTEALQYRSRYFNFLAA